MSDNKPATKNVRITAKLKASARKHIHEPSFSLFESPTESELLHNITWYNHYFDQKKSKDWAIEWIAKNDRLSAQKKQFNEMPPQWFGNKGFFCRMAENGWRMESERREKFENAFLEMLEMYKKANPESEIKTPLPAIKYDGPRVKEDPFWESLVDCEDSIIANKGELNKDVELAFYATIERLTINGKKRAIKTLEKHRKQLVADVKWAGDNIMHEDKRTSKRIIRCLIKYYDKWATKSIKI